MMNDRTLLADYVTNGSELAFREVVNRYINLVYSTAVRLVNRDAHLAEDVAQVVFADLARLAGTLSPGVMLGGWLHRRTCHVASNTMRSIRRRQNRERQAAEMNDPQHTKEDVFAKIAPVLDDAINELGDKDRNAIMLRFFENRDLRSVGSVLGGNEDAAQKRISRALEKLRMILVRRGVTASATVLATALGAHAVSAAPASLAILVSNAALASAASSGGLTLTVLKLMAMTPIKAAVSTLVIVGIGTTLVLEYRAMKRLREENHSLQQQIDQLAQKSTVPHPIVVTAAEDPALAQAKQLEEKKRLQNEIDVLRQQSNALAKLRQEHRQLRSVVNEPEDPAQAEYEKEQRVRVNHSKQWGLFFHIYANDHKGQFPGAFEQAAKAQGMESMLEYATNNLDIVYSGSLSNISPDAIIIKEKHAKLNPKGEWIKVYGFADGSVQVHTEPDEAAFAAWEKKRMVNTK